MDDFRSLKLITRPWVPAGTAILVSPDTIFVPEGLTLEQQLELRLIELAKTQRLVLIMGLSDGSSKE